MRPNFHVSRNAVNKQGSNCDIVRDDKIYSRELCTWEFRRVVRRRRVRYDKFGTWDSVTRQTRVSGGEYVN